MASPPHIPRSTGVVFVVSGPSGSGKRTVVAPLLADETPLRFSVSLTTRDPRRDEVDGRDYRFVTDDEFRRALAEGRLLEHTRYAEHLYGTPADPVLQAVAAGRDILLEIEPDGAAQVKEKVPEAVLVLVLPPSAEELRRRIRGRATESPAEIAARAVRWRDEIGSWGLYDYVLINDDPTEATADLRAIMRAERLRTRRQAVAGFIAEHFAGVEK